jgi:large subunit ribosomal protein L17
MRHGNKNRTLSRNRGGRAALLRGLAVSLIRDEQITTTHAKAKELQPRIERLITIAKNDTVVARRLVASRLGNPADVTIKKLFGTLAPKFVGRAGGYTRVVKMGKLASGRDAAAISFVQ